MKRRLFNIAAAVSLVLCAASVVLWVRSYWRQDGWTRKRVSGQGFDHYEVRSWQVTSARGGCRIVYEHGRNVWFARDEPGAFYSRECTFDHYPYWIDDSRIKFAGLQVMVEDWSDNGSRRHAIETVVPDVGLAFCFAVAPGLWWWKRLRRGVNPGRCMVCGYDLRATPGRCPECGTEVSAADVNVGVKAADA